MYTNSSALDVDTILTQPIEDNMDHPNAYASRKLNRAERNYSKTEREGLGMVFSNEGMVFSNDWSMRVSHSYPWSIMVHHGQP